MSIDVSPSRAGVASLAKSQESGNVVVVRFALAYRAVVNGFVKDCREALLRRRLPSDGGSVMVCVVLTSSKLVEVICGAEEECLICEIFTSET